MSLLTDLGLGSGVSIRLPAALTSDDARHDDEDDSIAKEREDYEDEETQSEAKLGEERADGVGEEDDDSSDNAREFGAKSQLRTHLGIQDLEPKGRNEGGERQEERERLPEEEEEEEEEEVKVHQKPKIMLVEAMKRAM